MAEKPKTVPHLTFADAIAQINNGGRWAMDQEYQCVVVEVYDIATGTTKDGKVWKRQTIELSDGTDTISYTDWAPPTNLVKGKGAKLTGAIIKAEERNGKKYFAIMIQQPGKKGLIVPMDAAPCYPAKGTPALSNIASKDNRAEVSLKVKRAPYPFNGIQLKSAIDVLFKALWNEISQERKEALLKLYPKEFDILDLDGE